MSTTQVRAFREEPLVRNSLVLAAFQPLLILLSLCIAWLLRFDFSLPYRSVLLSAAPVLVIIRISAMAYFKLLHGWWQYTGLRDLVDLLKAITLGSIVFLVVMRFVFGVTQYPRSIYFLEALVTTALLGGIRALSRVLAESVRKDAEAKRIMLIGAGFAAQMVIREIERPGSAYCIVGCVDDDPAKIGLKIQGVPVIGTADQLPVLVATHAVDQVLIAVPSATGMQMQRLVSLCEKAAVEFKTVPALQDIIAGRVSISQFRDVHLEDLLGRDPVEIDLESVRKQIEGRVVLVTGAAGTIGSELCRQILQYSPHRLLCLDQSETGIFYLQLELTERNTSGSDLVFHVADFGDCERMRSFILEHGPQIVFHAAAYKHVPVMEWNVHGALKNNILALLTFINLAEEGGCQSFVLISSDKAVNPTSVMGVSKRIGELIIAARPSPMRCVSVRFGNVLGSNGSVIPVLQRQLRNNQQLTVTHPEIRRFFMTTREAVSLVLQAFSIGNRGDTLVLDMGTPVRILDLAKTLIRLSGKSEDEVGIKFTGLRDGEKLFEELFYPSEEVQPTSVERIKRIRGGHNRWFELKCHLEELKASIGVSDPGRIRAKMKEIVPEYSYQLQSSEITDSIEPRTPGVFGEAAGAA